MNELLHTSEMPTAEVQPVDDRPALGSWWWVTETGTPKQTIALASKAKR